MPPKKAPATTLATIRCPHCGADSATIHAQKNNGLLYYRCYGGPAGDCGTVQLFGEGGQRWLREQVEAASGAAEPAPVQDTEPAEPDPAVIPAKAGNIEGGTPAPTPADPEPAPKRAAAAEPAGDALNIGAFFNRIFTE